MTIDTAEHSTTPRQKTPLSEARREELIHDLALNPLPTKVIAATYGITYQWCRQIKADNKDRIAEIRAQAEAIAIEEAGKSIANLWVLDPHNRHAIRQGALTKILEKQAALENSTDIWEQEHWAKLETLKQQILRYLEDAAGQLPTRAPAVVAEGSKMTYTVEGVDVSQVVNAWLAQQVS